MRNGNHSTTCFEMKQIKVKIINIYRNTRLKLLVTNAAIWYNKTCRNKHLQPKYIQIKTENNMDIYNRLRIYIDMFY